MHTDPSRSSPPRPRGRAEPEGDAMRQWKAQLRAEKAKNVLFVFIGLAAVGALGWFTLLKYRELNAPRSQVANEPARAPDSPDAPRRPLLIQDSNLYLMDDLLNVKPRIPEPGQKTPLDNTWVKQAGHHLASAEKALAEGRLGMALTHYKKALEIYPDLQDVQRFVGTIHLEEKRYGEALACFEKALAEGPQSKEIHCGILNNMGGVHRNLKKPAEAERYFREAMKLDGGYLKAHFNLAGLLHEQERLPEAAELYGSYLAKDPRNARAAEYHASLLIKLKRWAEASAELEKILISEPDIAPLHFHLAQAYAQSKEPEKSLSALKRAVTLVDSSKSLAWINQSEFDPLRTLPAFQSLVAELSQKASRVP